MACMFRTSRFLGKSQRPENNVVMITDVQVIFIVSCKPCALRARSQEADRTRPEEQISRGGEGEQGCLILCYERF